MSAKKIPGKHVWLCRVGHQNGDVEEVRLIAGWDPEKIEHTEVAQVAAIEHNVLRSDRDSQGNPTDPVIPISAELVAA